MKKLILKHTRNNGNVFYTAHIEYKKKFLFIFPYTDHYYLKGKLKYADGVMPMYSDLDTFQSKEEAQLALDNAIVVMVKEGKERKGQYLQSTEEV